MTHSLIRDDRTVGKHMTRCEFEERTDGEIPLEQTWMWQDELRIIAHHPLVVEDVEVERTRCVREGPDASRLKLEPLQFRQKRPLMQSGADTEDRVGERWLVDMVGRLALVDGGDGIDRGIGESIDRSTGCGKRLHPGALVGPQCDEGECRPLLEAQERLMGLRDIMCPDDAGALFHGGKRAGDGAPGALKGNGSPVELADEALA